MTESAAFASEIPPASAAPLKVRLRRRERRRKLKAVALVLPLLLFVMVGFALPIAAMLWRSIDNPEMAEVLPRTAEAVRAWDGEGEPGEPLFAALAVDLKEAQAQRTTAIAGKRLNFSQAGLRNLLNKSAQRIANLQQPTWRDTFVSIDPRWGERDLWLVMRRASGPLTPDYLLAAVDRRVEPDGAVRPAPAGEAIYLQILGRTFWISATVTGLCVALGYPVAMLMALASPRVANLLLVFVLLPFWSSLLVRTTAWVVLLQNEGLVNKALTAAGIIEKPFDLIFNRTGVLIAMTHVLLPFMVLPLYSVLRNIPIGLVRAALSLGAGPWTVFRRVYLPLSLPGVAGGGLLVFILALGYYITPALVGGAGDQMISWFIAFHTGTALNWGMAAALAAILMASVSVLYGVYNRLVGPEALRLG